MADNTAYQANFKLADGTLINIYAVDGTAFEIQLGVLQDMATLIHSVSASLGSAGVANVRKAFPGATPVAAPAAPSAGEGQMCKHGAMVYKEGTSARGPWKAWMCAAPKGAPDKCEAIWIR